LIHTTRGVRSCYPLCFCSVAGLLWGAKSRFEMSHFCLGHTPPYKPRRTLTEPRRTLKFKSSSFIFLVDSCCVSCLVFFVTGEHLSMQAVFIQKVHRTGFFSCWVFEVDGHFQENICSFAILNRYNQIYTALTNQGKSTEAKAGRNYFVSGLSVKTLR
jgi:hypothetical protein